MQSNFLKAIFTSAIILTSTIANAGIINQWDIDFTALNGAGELKVADRQGATSKVVTPDVLGDIFTLNKNSWYFLDLSAAIGQSSLNLDSIDTTLSFDFMTSGTPEIGGIQISNANRDDEAGAFNLIGTQDWGFDNYSYNSINNWVRFDINLTELLTGDFSRIMFINDCDECSTSNIDVSFRNMTITQSSGQSGAVAQVPEPTTLAIFALGVIGLASRRFKK